MITFNGRRVALTALAIGVAIQFVPILRDNPPVTAPLTKAPADVAAMLHRACYNCHSSETIWPWYSYVAPVSWLVARDVHQGRRHLDFSAWSGYTPAVRLKRLASISTLVTEQDMPPWFYRPLHQEAALSPDDIERLVAWADGGGL
jgi:hypothetical protein